MPAIISDQFRILNAANFVAGVADTSQYYYSFIGLPNSQDIGAGGTISAITVNEGGFGYTPGTNPTVLLSQEAVTRERCNTVNVTGDYGVVVGAVSYTHLTLPTICSV